jgi:hypothetical protein
MNFLFFRKSVSAFLFVGLFFLMLPGCILIKRLDRTPYTETNFYQKTIDTINRLQPAIENNNELLCGWAKVNLQPPYPTTIAIDAARKGKKFEGIRDSIYARVFVFKQGDVKVAYVSADLLILPPTVAELLDSILQQDGFNLNNIYLTATHTHTSIGAWHNSYVGKIFAGKFDSNIPKHIANCIALAVKTASNDLQPSKIGYTSVPASRLVFNRLVGEKGKVDSMIRIVKIERANGTNAAMISFTAHATIFHEKMMQLSADWPGETVKQIEQSGKANFACFSAGAVGSHGPFEHSKVQEDELKYIATGVAAIAKNVLDTLQTYSVSLLQMQRVPIYLREPQMRINKYFALWPKWFYKLFGNMQMYINKLQIGNLVFIGMPCDFSGELSYNIEPMAKEMDLALHLTSFNGGYGGYITDDEWYELDAYETRTMGWFGPGNGDYFSELGRRLLEK